MHPKSHPEEQLAYVFPLSDHRCTVHSVSFVIHNFVRQLSKSEVKQTISGILLVSIDIFGRCCSKTVVVSDTSRLVL